MAFSVCLVTKATEYDDDTEACCTFYFSQSCTFVTCHRKAVSCLSLILQPSGIFALGVALSILFTCSALIGRWDFSVYMLSVGMNTRAIVSCEVSPSVLQGICIKLNLTIPHCLVACCCFDIFAPVHPCVAGFPSKLPTSLCFLSVQSVI